MPETQVKKVAIVGCASSKALAPFDDPSFEIWGMNNLFLHIPRWTRWFEIHPLKFEGGSYYRRDLIRPGVFEWSKQFRGQAVNDYIIGLAGLKVPVYMQNQWADIPTSELYPTKKVLEAFPRAYFTNSVSYMIALALVEGFTEIHIYGIDMAVDTEYHHQRPSCEYFIGLAEGMGVRVVIPAESDLLKTRFLYGFQEQEASSWDKKVKDIQNGMRQRRAKCEQERAEAEKRIQQYIGAEMAVEELKKIWG